VSHRSGRVTGRSLLRALILALLGLGAALWGILSFRGFGRLVQGEVGYPDVQLALIAGFDTFASLCCCAAVVAFWLWRSRRRAPLALSLLFLAVAVARIVLIADAAWIAHRLAATGYGFLRASTGARRSEIWS
jgi:hypothetical protein